MNKRKVQTNGAPAALGPYSQGVVMDGWILTAGQAAIDPETGELVEADVAKQTDRTLRNIQAILEAAGSNMDRIVRATVYLTDMNDYAAMNSVYKSYFSEPFPARTCVEVSRLPGGTRVEIDAIAKVADR
jgi:2-iminobutanoate/2-iminopropanoate deaminase